MQLSRNLLFLVCLSIGSHAFVMGDGPALSLHVNENGRFEALMPASTNDSTIEGKELTDTKYQSEALVDGVAYRVRVQVISPIRLDDEFTESMAKSLIDQARQKHKAAANNNLVTDRVFKQHGIATAAFAYNSPAGNGATLRHRMMFDGQRLYLASVTGPSNLVKTTAADTFLNSIGPAGSNAKKAAASQVTNTTAAGGQNPNGLKLFVSETMGVQGLMPADVKEVKDNRQLIAFGRSGEKGFMISVKPLNDSEQAEFRALTPAKLGDDLRSLIRVFVRNGTEESITYRGFHGIQSTGKMDGVPHKARARTFASPKAIVVLATWGEGEYVTSKEASVFLDSLELLEAKSPPKAAGSPVDTAASSASSGLQRYVNRELGFEALMPESVQKLDTPVGPVVVGQIGTSVFVVAVTPLGETDKNALRTATPARRLDLLRVPMKVSIPNDEAKPITRQNSEGLEASGFPPEQTQKARARVFASDTNIYRIVTWGDGDHASSADATKFLDSLVIDEFKTKKAIPPKRGKASTRTKQAAAPESNELSSLIEKRNQLVQSFGRQHPSVLALDKEIDRLKEASAYVKEAEAKFKSAEIELEKRAADRERRLKQRGVK